MKFSDASSLHQHLPTDVSTCCDRLKEHGASDDEKLHNGAARTSSSKTSSSLFTPVTHFVNSQTLLSDLIAQQQGSSSEHRLMLTGLHTCGNLSVDILRLFAATHSVKVACQVGCCYNLLGERFLHVPGTSECGNASLHFAMLLAFPD